MFWNKKKTGKVPRFVQIPHPKEAVYKVVLGKDLSVGNIIIHNYQRCLITEVSQGRGAGSFEFGEYVGVVADKLTSWSNAKSVDFWTYENCPIILETVE